MEPSITVALAWILFAGTHIGLATRSVRAALVQRLGLWGFTLVFSLVAAVAFSLLVHGYAVVRVEGAAGPALGRFQPIAWLATGSIELAFVLIVGSLWAFPASVGALVTDRVPAPRGLERLTRHPFFVGVALLGISHAVVATRLVSVVMFGALAAFAIVGGLHQDAKLRRLMGNRYAAYLEQTSFWPFAAIVAGRQRLVLSELPWTALAAGLALSFWLRSVHASILGPGFGLEGGWVIAVVVGGAGVALVQTWLKQRRAHTRPVSPVAGR
jgi:uncharacterized membrane protein